MDEESLNELQRFHLNAFEYDILQTYIKHGYGNVKVYHTTFFIIHDDEIAMMTLQEYYDKVNEIREKYKDYYVM